MAGLIESEAVFKQRCAEIGISPAGIAHLVTANFTTMARFAYGCSYVPGASDDAKLLEMIDKIVGQRPPDNEVALYRRLFFESFTLVQADLKLKLERCEDAPARKLAVPERAHRYRVQAAKLAGLSLRGELEPADSLVDEAVSQHDDNRVRYIKWDKLLKREQEMEGIKKFDALTTRRDGTVKVGSTEELPAADTSSEYLLRNALLRRGLAYDQAGLIDFHIHEAWVEELMSARMRTPSKGCARVSVEQLEDADKALFFRLSELTRDGIIPDALGVRPLDRALPRAMVEPRIANMLANVHVGASSSSAAKRERDRSDSPKRKWLRQDKGAKGAKDSGGKGKGKDKAKGAGKSAALPTGLEGSSRTPDGSHICFGYNFKTCTEQSKSGCSKGKHVCTKCFKTHPFLEHA